MADMHIIAVDTYGAQRIKHPHTGKTVSAYKLSYTSAVMPVLLALYGDNARDVSPKQASYRYLQIDAEVTVRHGHILLTVSTDELAQAEAITRQHISGATGSGGRCPIAPTPITLNPAIASVRTLTRPDFVHHRHRRLNKRARRQASRLNAVSARKAAGSGGGCTVTPTRTATCSSGMAHVGVTNARRGTPSARNCLPRSVRL